VVGAPRDPAHRDIRSTVNTKQSSRVWHEQGDTHPHACYEGVV